MKYDPEIHHRRSIRLRDYDYSANGAYFVTVCAQGRECLWGEVEEGSVRLNLAGEIVQAVWEGLPEHYPHLALDAFVVMPNHVHAIIILQRQTGVGLEIRAGLRPAPTPDTPGMAMMNQDKSVGAGSVGAGLRPALVPEMRDAPLSEVVRAFKSFSSRQINRLRDNPGVPVWQRNYYERIIRNEGELEHARAYIEENPMKWAQDKENPSNVP